MSVACSSVCLSVHTTELHQIFVHVDYGRGSVLWRRCDTLCTSGFVVDVMFWHSGYMARRVTEYDRQIGAEQPRFQLNSAQR